MAKALFESLKAVIIFVAPLELREVGVAVAASHHQSGSERMVEIQRPIHVALGIALI